MGFERRTVLALGLLSLMPGCAKAAQPRSLRTEAWADFKTRFLQPDGRVVDTGNGGISHSEGQGYGMVMAEAAGDRTAFEQIYRWTAKTMVRPDEMLFSWRYDPSRPNPIDDPNNATDGDILIAWALMRAADRWKVNEWHDRASRIRAAIHGHLVRTHGGRTLLLPGIVGFDHPDRVTVNPSYYIWPALDRFRKADGDALWGKLIGDGETLLADARFGPLALPTDWVDVAADGRASPAADKPPRFGFDAVRVPLYLMLGGRTAQADAIARFWRGYAAQNRPIPAWVDVVSGEAAPFPVSAGGCAIVHRLLGRSAPPCPEQGASDYYSSVLALLAAL